MFDYVAVVLELAVRLAFFVIFVTSAASKLRHPREFRQSLARYGISLWRARAIATWLIIAVEFGIAGAWLVAPSVLAATVTTASLVVFSIAGVQAVRRGVSIQCGCGGIFSSNNVGPATLTRNAVLTAVALATPGSGGGIRLVEFSELIVSACVAATLILLTIGLEEFIGTWIASSRAASSIGNAPRRSEVS